MTEKHLPGTTVRAFTRGDRVQIRPGVGGGVDPGDEGTVHAVRPLATSRPVKVALDDDPGDPRDFDVDELELIEAGDR